MSFMKKIKHADLLFLLFFSVTVNAQLSDFNFTIQKTDETCLANGSITFTVSNTTANASILYKVYRLPDVTTTINILDSNYLGGLTAGSYKVIAVQSLGSMQNSKEQTVTLDDKKINFNFTIAAANQNCAAGGTMVLTASAGEIATCEIISGPVRRPLQSSNVFDALPQGTYNVRAYDICGTGRVKTFTLSLVNSVLNISEAYYPNGVNLCDSITVNNSIIPSAGNINYPIRVRHTLSTMDIAGNSIVMEKVYATGNPTYHEISVVMPRYMNQEYTYDMEIIDNCADEPYLKDGITVNQDINLTLSAGDALCGEKFLRLNVSKFTNSYTVEFISIPSTDFDPYTYNATPFGPFTTGTVQYGGDELSLPFGNYTVKVTDSCGRTATQTILLEFTELAPYVYAVNNGCFSLFGYISAGIARQKIITASILDAPATYTGPRDVTSLISNGSLLLLDLPLGWYEIKFTDDCGFEYTRRLEVPAYVDRLFNLTALPSCTPGLGTVRFRSGNGKISQVSITVAPRAFALQHPLPFDATSLLDENGNLFMDNLPEGSYTFTGTDVCGAHSGLQTVNVEGYIPPVNPFEFATNCGGFSIKVTDRSNGLEGASYWMQKYNATTRTWGHPQNTNSYTEGETPNHTNAILLANNTIANLSFSGTFRIIKKFESFGNGTSNNTLCVSNLGQFNYTEQFAINTVYSLACLERPNDVMVDVTGYPTDYRIIMKDGQSYVVNNSANNTFTNLTPGEYVFQIQDACGNSETKTVFIQTLPTTSDPIKPRDMVSCVDASDALNPIFHLDDQNPQILGPLYSAMYDITFHLTQADADAGLNALSVDYPSTQDGQTIFVRMQNNIIALCGGTTSFKLYRGYNQEPVITKEGTLCNDGMIKLIANAGYDKYQWSTGETTRSIFVNSGGDYTVTVLKKYGDNFGCPGTATFSVEQSFTPVITKIVTEDWTTDENMITILTLGENEYTYSIDGVRFQVSNVFTGLESGRYTVYVKDTKGCGITKQEVVLLNYPKFFTPNGDGSNETWQIKNSATEPHMHISIFDRYGKLVTAFGSDAIGWDGTLNGIQLPSTDYWFVVTREDGRELKGHFSMMR
jgi:gliding motility-associated-like protein